MPMSPRYWPPYIEASDGLKRTLALARVHAEPQLRELHAGEYRLADPQLAARIELAQHVDRNLRRRLLLGCILAAAASSGGGR